MAVIYGAPRCKAIGRSACTTWHGSEIPKLSTRVRFPSLAALQETRSRVRDAGSRWGTAGGMCPRVSGVREARKGCLRSPHSCRLLRGAR